MPKFKRIVTKSDSSSLDHYMKSHPYEEALLKGGRIITILQLRLPSHDRYTQTNQKDDRTKEYNHSLQTMLHRKLYNNGVKLKYKLFDEC